MGKGRAKGLSESTVQGDFGRWVERSGGLLELRSAFGVDGAAGGAFAVELKVARQGRFAYRAVEQHQRDALLRWGHGCGLSWCAKCESGCGAACGAGLVGGVGGLAGDDGADACYHKISDMSAGAKPFDCFVVSGGVGLVGVAWEDENGGYDGSVDFVEIGAFEAMRCAGIQKNRRGSRSLLRDELVGGGAITLEIA